MRRVTTLTLLAVLTVCVSARAAVEWERNYKAALQKARNENKLVMVDMYAAWCGPCRLLDKNTFSNKDVEAKLSNGFIAVKIDLDKSPEAPELARKFAVNAIPHIVFLDADGKRLSDIVGYVPPDDFLKELDGATKKAAKK
jgi:thiol:disulfide interchange protein